MSDDRPVDLTQRRVARNAQDTVATYVPLISFENRGAECMAGCGDFVLGFEAGQLSARLDAKPETWGGTYHERNLDMLERVSSARGYVATVTRSEDPTWVFIDFATARPALSLVPPEET